MSLSIGIDFDNTIACYDHVFTNVARQEKLVDVGKMHAKAQIKAAVLEDPNGDTNWQRLQGKIYGKYMYLASAFPGFAEFLVLAKLRGHLVSVVSHKSEFGHFDEERVPLRDEAVKWLVANSFLGAEKWMLSRDDIFFNETRSGKISQIIKLGNTHFIDDLPEVFAEPSFPSGVSRYLFNSAVPIPAELDIHNAVSWRTLIKDILGEWTPAEISSAAGAVFPALDIKDAILIKGRGNSRIYQLCAHNGTKYALKIYPDRHKDQRQRLETEFLACSALRLEGFSVMEAVEKNTNMNWAVYGWVDGEIIGNADERFIDHASDFIVQLNKSRDKFTDFPLASEACLTGSEIILQISKRREKLSEVNSEVLSAFLQVEFLPQFYYFVRLAKQVMGKSFDMDVPRSLLVPSPSDFGAHNAIMNKAGKTVFIDFEYFGWDDPVKLVSDFYWHPAMNLSPDLKNKWIVQTGRIFAGEQEYEKRLNAYLPLFGLRWCLILLNEFLPERLAQRIHADRQKQTSIHTTLQAQLDKARSLLDSIKKSM